MKLTTWTVLLLWIVNNSHSEIFEERIEYCNLYTCDDKFIKTPCDIKLTRDILTKNIVFITFQVEAIICNACDIGDLRKHNKLSVDDNVRIVDLSESNVTAISGKSIRGLNVRYLYLSRNNIDGPLEKWHFRKTPQLQKLDLSHNRIQEIHVNAFDLLPYMEVLLLPFNRIEYLHGSTFSQLINLRVVELHNNALRTIDTHLFASNPYLFDVTLYDNDISTVGDNVLERLEQIQLFNLPDLKYQLLLNEKSGKFDCIIGGSDGPFGWDRHFEPELTVNSSCKYITHVPVSSLKVHTKFLNLRNNRIEGLHESRMFFKSPDLHTLDLEHNKIEEISRTAFDGLTKLEVLLLSYNNIPHLSPAIFANLTNLRILHVNNNKIRDIAASLFTGNFRLIQLKLSNNVISEVGKSAFSQLRTLELLDLSNNAFGPLSTVYVNATYVNVSNSRIHQLHVGTRVYDLDASDNLLTSTDINIGSSLYKVDFSGNRFATLTFKNLAYLSVINVSQNNLLTLIIQHLPNLKTLDVSNNLLQSITLHETDKLIHLNVSRNRLESVFEFLSDKNKRIHTLDLSHNNIGDIERSIFRGDNRNITVLNLRNSGLKDVNELLNHLRMDNLQLLDISYNNLKKFNPASKLNFFKVTHLYIDGNALRDINVKRVIKIFRSLDQISIADNDWSCAGLAGMIEIFDRYFITVTPPDVPADPDTINVNGIHCAERMEIVTDAFNGIPTIEDYENNEMYRHVYSCMNNN